jgi:hypothetical protein
MTAELAVSGVRDNQETCMKVTKPGAFKDSHWRQRFADSLLKLAPGVNPDAADELSDSQFLGLSEMTPEDAAARYVASSVQPKAGGPRTANETASWK